MSNENGRNWYKSLYLKSNHFKYQREIAWMLAFHRCAICWQRYDLQPHHLSYRVINTWYEFLFLRYVCSRHHKQVQYFFGRHLSGTLALHLRYYAVKAGYWATCGLLRCILSIVHWLVTSYAIPRHHKR